MKKSAINKLGVGVLTIVLIGGCQLISWGPSNEELINAAMTDWKAALIAQDLDKFMAVHSENYVSTEGNTRALMREFMAGVFEEGYLDDVEVNLENATTTIEDGKAEVRPIELSTVMLDKTIELTLKKENGDWLIVGSNYQE